MPAPVRMLGRMAPVSGSMTAPLDVLEVEADAEDGGGGRDDVTTRRGGGHCCWVAIFLFASCFVPQYSLPCFLALSTLQLAPSILLRSLISSAVVDCNVLQ